MSIVRLGTYHWPMQHPVFPLPSFPNYLPSQFTISTTNLIIVCQLSNGVDLSMWKYYKRDIFVSKLRLKIHIMATVLTYSRRVILLLRGGHVKKKSWFMSVLRKLKSTRVQYNKASHQIMLFLWDIMHGFGFLKSNGIRTPEFQKSSSIDLTIGGTRERGRFMFCWSSKMDDLLYSWHLLPSWFIDTLIISYV